MDMKVCKRRRTSKTKTKAPPPAELLEELVTEILVRLPVKSLLRFKSVSKAWHAIISDPFFIRSHLRQSASRWRRNPSLLVTPHALEYVREDDQAWPSTFSTEIRFYQWQQPSSEESLAMVMHAGDFLEEFRSVCYFAHCDGLVLAPTDFNLYLFNPATMDAVRLPHSGRDRMHQFQVCLPVGLGRDPRTGSYKVVQAFYLSRDPLTGVHRMGMEVFTVAGDAYSWSKTTADPPYPVADWITAVFAKGGLFWVIDKRGLDPSPHGLLRLSLDDETFSVTRLPDSLDPALDESFLLDEMHGELCLTAFSSGEQQPLKIWTLVEEHGRWEHRYSLTISEMVRPVALLPGGGAMLVRRSHHLCHYDLGTRELDTVCELDRLRYHRSTSTGTDEEADLPGREIFCFNVIPYTESLVPITAAAS